jgi:hypothetical protein
MAVPYAKLISNVGLRLNALVGALPADLETTYKKATQVVGDYESADFPFTFVKDLVIQAEAKYAGIIAGVETPDGEGHPFRNALHAVTASIANGAVIPSTSSGGDKIIGSYGSVRDATDGKPLSRRSLSSVRRFVRETWRTTSRYGYSIDGVRLYHTRTNATIDVCVYNSATRRALMDSDQTASMLLADSLELGLICEAVSMAFRDDAFPAQAEQYRTYSLDQIALLQRGSTSTPQRLAA